MDGRLLAGSGAAAVAVLTSCGGVPSVPSPPKGDVGGNGGGGGGFVGGSKSLASPHKSCRCCSSTRSVTAAPFLGLAAATLRHLRPRCDLGGSATDAESVSFL